MTGEKLSGKNFLPTLFYVLDQSEHSKGLKMAAKDFREFRSFLCYALNKIRPT
jgi:hypothetical protein